MSCKTNLDLAKSEGEAMRQQKTIKWLVLVIALLILCLVGTNAFWIYHESQYKVEKNQVVEQVADNGTNNFVGGDLVGNAKDNNNN